MLFKSAILADEIDLFTHSFTSKALLACSTLILIGFFARHPSLFPPEFLEFFDLHSISIEAISIYLEGSINLF